MTDERKGLPSASSALQDSLCPGRFKLQKQWEEFSPEPEPEEDADFNPDDIDSDAEAGKRIHLLYAGKDCPGASQAEIDRADKALRVDKAMKEQWLSSFDLEPLGEVTEMREHRWWLYDGEEPIYSGQTDAVWIRGIKGEACDILVADLKGLWGHHDDAPINMQIRRYIALIAVNIQANGYFSEARSASAYLNQPAKTLTPVMTTYDTDGIDTAIMEMQLDLAAMQEADPVRRAGPVQCAKCKGKLICPEFEAAQPMQMATIDGAPGRPLSKETIELHLDRLPGVDLARVLDWVPALDHLCSLAKNEAKKRLREDATSVPGWGIKPNAPRSQVEDLAKVYGRLITEYQITGLEFSTACSITKKNVIQIVRDKSGLKGASLDSKVKEILDGATREIKVSNSLEKVK